MLMWSSGKIKTLGISFGQLNACHGQCKFLQVILSSLCKLLPPFATEQPKSSLPGPLKISGAFMTHLILGMVTFRCTQTSQPFLQFFKNVLVGPWVSQIFSHLTLTRLPSNAGHQVLWPAKPTCPLPLVTILLFLWKIDPVFLQTCSYGWGCQLQCSAHCLQECAQCPDEPMVVWSPWV